MNKAQDRNDNLIENQVFSRRDPFGQTHSETGFHKLAMEIFKFQYKNNSIYNQYISELGVKIDAILKLSDIPFLPISFFKSHKIICGQPEQYNLVFHSSATTSDIPSTHFVKDINLYIESFKKGFAQFYGDIKQYCLLALLPSYLERTDSSLVYMVNELIRNSGNADSGFYMNNYLELANKIRMNEGKGQKTLLLGVTYALLKFAEEYPMDLRSTIIMETGGMKGRREELSRVEVHKLLSRAFKVENIHSEYGMTELLSQAYSKGKGVFKCVPWMKILIRDIYDPFAIADSHQLSANSFQGAINIIDLANINSCSFLATDDLGIVQPNGDFEVVGRLDSSDIRGCNIMASEL